MTNKLMRWKIGGVPISLRLWRMNAGCAASNRLILWFLSCDTSSTHSGVSNMPSVFNHAASSLFTSQWTTQRSSGSTEPAGDKTTASIYNASTPSVKEFTLVQQLQWRHSRGRTMVAQSAFIINTFVRRKVCSSIRRCHFGFNFLSVSSTVVSSSLRGGNRKYEEISTESLKQHLKGLESELMCFYIWIFSGKMFWVVWLSER